MERESTVVMKPAGIVPVCVSSAGMGCSHPALTGPGALWCLGLGLEPARGCAGPSQGVQLLG